MNKAEYIESIVEMLKQCNDLALIDMIHRLLCKSS